MPVWRSESNVAADMEDAPCAGASLEPITELIDLTEDSDVELCATSKKRARRNECSPVKEWFCNLTVCHPDWSVEHFFVDELEDSWAGDEPSEPETVTAEPLPSAPADPVQILTRFQALRIVYGTYAPKY